MGSEMCIRDRGCLIIAGFQGLDENQDTTTLGRGGSDTTAVALAAALSADTCEIFTDVAGVYTSDPRLCPLARPLLDISYDEMLEMATTGAGVMHPRAVEVGQDYDVTIHVRSTIDPESAGTFIRKEACLLYTSPSPRDATLSRMPSSA